MVDDYRLTLKFTNNRIVQRIAEKGYGSVMDFCRRNHLTCGTVYDLVNMKVSPLIKWDDAKGGQWKLAVKKIAEILDVLPEDLFSSEQMQGLKQNVISTTVIEDRLMTLIGAPRPQLPSDACGEKIVHDRLDEIISGLEPRQADVLRRRFGWDGPAETLKEVGNTIARLDDNQHKGDCRKRRYGVSPEITRHIEAKALKCLRHPSRLKILEELLESYEDADQGREVGVPAGGWPHEYEA
jgi:hypothetical protein